MPSIRVYIRDRRNWPENWPGYAFAYPAEKNVITPIVTFAFLSHEYATTLIKLKVVTKEAYKVFLDEFSMYKESYRVYQVGEKGLSLDECDSTMDSDTAADYLSSINDMQKNKLHLRKKGRMHAIWKPCNTFEITDIAMLTKVILQTYGNFGVTPSKS